MSAGNFYFPHAYSRRFLLAGLAVGFALGGFFDGILLHQILQWHHLLSGYQTGAFSDLRVQVMADGLFHGLMYLLAAAGLWTLYQARGEFTGASADRALAANLLVGFGAWHVVDTVFSHWLTGIHRIRMDVPDPLTWDIFWLVLFGLAPLAAGLAMKRRYPDHTVLEDRRNGGRSLLISLAALTVLAGGWALMPPAGAAGTDSVTVVLRPNVRPGEFLAALARTDARVLWSDRAGGVWILTAGGESALSHYARGAMYVSGSLLPAGCSAWVSL